MALLYVALTQVSGQHHKSVRPSCWYYRLYETEIYDFRLDPNIIMCIRNFIEIRPAVLKLNHADRQAQLHTCSFNAHRTKNAHRIRKPDTENTWFATTFPVTYEYIHILPNNKFLQWPWTNGRPCKFNVRYYHRPALYTKWISKYKVNVIFCVTAQHGNG
jgi:hypothetical protein